MFGRAGRGHPERSGDLGDAVDQPHPLSAQATGLPTTVDFTRVTKIIQCGTQLTDQRGWVEPPGFLSLHTVAGQFDLSCANATPAWK